MKPKVKPRKGVTAMVKKLTPKQRVLRKFRSAKCIRDSHGNGFCIHRGAFNYRGLTHPVGDCWMPTEAQAWADASRKLK